VIRAQAAKQLKRRRGGDGDRAQKHGNVISKIIARMTETTKENLTVYPYI